MSRIEAADLTASMQFTLAFAEVPDFLTLDPRGRAKDSFQVFIALDPQQENPARSPDVIIRGHEIHIAHALRIRDARPPVSDPSAGGWGAIRGTVPYNVSPQKNGKALLTFSVPFGLLGVTGRFGYCVETYSFGSMQDHWQGVAP